MNLQAQRDISHKLKVFEHAAGSGNVAFTCRHFGISRETYYQWKRAYAAHGERGLINSKPCPENPKLRTSAFIEEKIILSAPQLSLRSGKDQLVSGSLSRY
jgi:transposase-like protein